MILNDEEIRRLIAEKQLVRNYIDVDKQLTPNGFDLSVEKIFGFVGKGQIGFTNDDRILPELREIAWKNNSIELNSGCYKVRTNEILKMPLDLIAIAMPRSSLLRSGVTVSTGIWDAGFEGISEFLLQVNNFNGFTVMKNARVVQLIFMLTKQVKLGYDGLFNLKKQEK
jgi:dUTP pyrophosphatase